jgi:hypothetical protein
MSRELQRFLVNPEITGGMSWTTGITPSVTGRGSIHYQALRLARTEINNTYRESMALNNLENPIALGVKWNLSKQHPRPDICDIYAQVDQYGRGPGVFPANALPLDHPNGMCFFTEMLRVISQWERAKQPMTMLDLSENEILAPLAGQTDATRTAAMKSYDAMNTILKREIKKYKIAS